MILNRNESDVTILGDVQKYKVSIDENNLQHIITILSSNLYSHPMQSFLREIVSNAVDSHLEAKVDEPIIITITDNDLAIRDFGTGISPERFHETYINIGSSTKRDSNEFIGHFGIGKYSALAVSDIVNVTSFYNGKAYYYVMNKDIDQLHIDLILEKDTDEHNGVEVKIPFKAPLQDEDWKALAFIKNLYIEDERKYPDVDQNSIISSFNKRKVYTYKTFKVLEIGYPYSTKGRYTEVLVGNIPYRVDYGSLWDENRYDNWEDAFKKVCPCLNIGEVDITPNREGLLYSERTKKALRNAYNEAIDELTTLWEASCNEECTDFRQFAYAIKNHYGNELKLEGGIRVDVDNDLPYIVKMKDFPEYDYKELKDIIRTLLYSSTDYVIACLDRNEMQKGRRLLEQSIERIMDKCDDTYTAMIAMPTSYGISSKYLKGFLSEQFPNQRVMLLREPHISLGRVRSFIRQKWGITTLTDSKKMHLIIACLKHLMKYFSQHIRRWDIINSPEYLQYKEDNKEEKVYVRNNTKVPCHIWYPSDKSPETETDTPNNLIRSLHNRYKKARIVYAQLDSPFIYGFKGINYPNLIIIGLAQNNYQLAEKGMFPDYVRPIEELYSPNNRTLQRIAAMEYVRSKVSITTLGSTFPKPLREMAARLDNLSDKYLHLSHYDYRFDGAYSVLKVVPEEKYDKEIIALYHQLEKPYEVQRKISNRYGSKSDFFWYFLMKAKKFRLDYDYYKCIRDDIDKITNLL